MRRILAISILLISLLLPGWLVYAFFLYQKQQVKETVKEQLLGGIHSSALVELRFSRSEASALLDWEDEREFEYRGRMYDVLATTIQGDSISYQCWPDDAESELNRRLDRLVGQGLGHDPAQQRITTRLHSFFSSLYCVQIPILIFPDGKSCGTVYHYFLPGSTRLHPPPGQPPEAVGS